MTQILRGLTTSTLSAEKVRSTPANLRHALSELAEHGTDVWAGPLADLADALVEVARVDLCLARLVEGHADGVRILSEAGKDSHPGVYGVWASRSVGTGIKTAEADGRWHLSGELRFASGVDLIDRALVAAWLDADHHVLLDVPADTGTADRDSWRAPGMAAANTYTVHLDLEAAEADRVGPTDFYLQRPGFVVGGLCVAAVWVGGAQQVVDVVTTSLRPFDASPHQLRRIGRMEQAGWQASQLLRSTVARVESAAGTNLDGSVTREIAATRTAAVEACEVVLEEAPRVVGPAGLSRNARLARVIDDLAVYIRQHHLDAELASLGQHALDTHELLAE